MIERNSAAKKARSLDAPVNMQAPSGARALGTASRLSGMRLARRSPRKTIAISGVCSMVGCTGAPIAAKKVSDFWVSQCLLHSKGHGKLDMNKVTR